MKSCTYNDPLLIKHLLSAILLTFFILLLEFWIHLNIIVCKWKLDLRLFSLFWELMKWNDNHIMENFIACIVLAPKVCFNLVMYHESNLWFILNEIEYRHMSENHIPRCNMYLYYHTFKWSILINDLTAIVGLMIWEVSNY